MTIDSADDSKISNRTINTNRILNRTYDSKSNRITKLCRSLYSCLKIENCWFYPPLPCLTPPSGGTPWDINIIYEYIPLKRTFSGLQFCPRHYGSIFIHLAVVSSQNRKIRRNSDKIWPYSSSRSPKVIVLGVNGKPICDFLLVINCNYDTDTDTLVLLQTCSWIAN